MPPLLFGCFWSSLWWCNARKSETSHLIPHGGWADEKSSEAWKGMKCTVWVFIRESTKINSVLSDSKHVPLSPLTPYHPIHMHTHRYTSVSLVAQWLRICLPTQGTWVRALIREDPTCCRATKLVHHNYWACTLEPTSHNYWACMPQLLKPARLEPMLCNKRSHCNAKPTHHNEE